MQTLSRLNRILPPEKTDTFVLDFRNDLEDIQEAFRPWYECTEAVPTDVNLLYNAHRELWAFGVFREDEVAAGVQALLAVSETSGSRRRPRRARPCPRPRFLALDEEVQDAFRDLLARFVEPVLVHLADRYVRRPTARARLPLRARPPRVSAGAGSRAARPGKRSRAHSPQARADLRGLGLARAGRGRGGRDLLRPRPPTRPRVRAPLADRRRHERALRPRAWRCGSAPLRPVRGVVGCRRIARRSRPQQRLPELPPRLRLAPFSIPSSSAWTRTTSIFRRILDDDTTPADGARSLRGAAVCDASAPSTTSFRPAGCDSDRVIPHVTYC